MILDEIEEISEPAAQYIRGIEPERYAYYAAPLEEYPRYFHTCSNLAESTMNICLEARKLSPLYALDYIWHKVMKVFYDRREQGIRDYDYLSDLNHTTRFYSALWDAAWDESGMYDVQPQHRGKGIALVKRGETAREAYTVNISRKICDCREWQDRRFPCRHALAAIRYFKNEDPYSFIEDIFTVKAYMDIYKGSLRPAPFDHIEPDYTTLPPIPSKKKGRPKATRYKRKTRHSEAKKVSRKKNQSALSNIQRERLNAQLDHYSDSEESWQGCSSIESGGEIESESGSELGSVNSNLEQPASRDQLAGVAGATVGEARAGDRATTPICISPDVSSSDVSSDESLESLGAIIRRGRKDRLQSSQASSDSEEIETIFKRALGKDRSQSSSPRSSDLESLESLVTIIRRGRGKEVEQPQFAKARLLRGSAYRRRPLREMRHLSRLILSQAFDFV